MPRNVRNFWLELEVDGKRTPVATGPVAEDGGFLLVLKIRNAGQVVYAGQLEGSADADGNLQVEWVRGSGEVGTLNNDIVIAKAKR